MTGGSAATGGGRSINSTYPDGIICTNGVTTIPLYFGGLKPSSENRIVYEGFPDVGGQHASLQFNTANGNYIAGSDSGGGGSAYGASSGSAIHACYQNLYTIPSFSYGGGGTGGNNGVFFKLCSNASTDPVCLAAKANGGIGDSYNRIVNCRRTASTGYPDGIIGLHLVYNNNVWKYYNVASILEPCVDGTALVLYSSGTTGSSPMLTGWPNAIACPSTSQPNFKIYYLEEKDTNSQIRYRAFDDRYFIFNSSKQFVSGHSLPSACDNKNVADLQQF
jgi:hypothetical protein